MFHLERGEHAEVLHLYDTGFRNLDSPVTQMQPDLYIDCQNARLHAVRLERQGVDSRPLGGTGQKAEARIGDCLSASPCRIG